MTEPSTMDDDGATNNKSTPLIIENVVKEYRSNIKSSLSQVLATLVASLLVVVQTVMPTIILGALHNKPNQELNLNDSQAAWLGSMLFLCQPVGSLASGFLCERFGRRGSMVLINIPFIIGWILLYLARSNEGLFVAALTMGTGVGFCQAPVSAYLGEIGEPHLRGSLFAIMISATSFGYLSSYFLASVMPWRDYALVNVIYPVITMILFTQIPESPMWLIHKGRLNEAQKALGWLRGFSEPHEIQEEFDRMVEHVTSSKLMSKPRKDVSRDDETSEGSRNIFLAGLSELKDPKLYLPLKLVFIMFLFTRCMSLQAFKPYLIGVLATLDFPFSQKWVLIIIGCVTFVGSVVPVYVFRFTGKRDLILYNQFISCVSVFGLGMHCTFFKDSLLGADSSFRWLPILFFAVGFFSSSVGIINIPWMLLGEVFPMRWRSFATGICGAWAYVVTFVTARLFLPMEKVLSLNGMFFLYGFIGIAGFAYFFVFLPETEGKTLKTIETYFTPHHDKREKFSHPKKVFVN